MATSLSLLIPAYNEEASLRPLYDEIRAALQSRFADFEIIFIDDGSTDGTWREIEKLRDLDSRVNGIRFRRNFGKSAALAAAFARAQGKYFVTLDADLQDDPTEIPRLIAKLEEGFGLVSGWKRTRHDKWSKVASSRLFNAVVSWTTGVRLHDHNCGLKAYRAEATKEFRLYGELHRFIPVLVHSRGYRVSEIETNHRARKHGTSKFGPMRYLHGVLDLITVKFLLGFGRRPSHWLGLIGMASAFVGAAGLTYLMGLWILAHGFGMPTLPLHQRPLLTYSVMFFLAGVQMLSFGLLAELITYYQGKRQDTFSIAETTDETSDKVTALAR